MKAPDSIKIGKYNIRSNGDVVFGWVENSEDCEAIQHDIEYIRKDIVEELKKRADTMYSSAQYLTTDAFRLKKAMEEYWHFINLELNLKR